MIFGDASSFAIDSHIFTAFSRLSLRALGYFNIFIKGERYGVFRPDATFLACSFDEVSDRLNRRGMHNGDMLRHLSASEISIIFRKIHYTGLDEISDSERGILNYSEVFYDFNLVWAPDGDAAFDDGSYIIHIDQLDELDQVRLIGFKSREGVIHSLNEVFLINSYFYSVLEKWKDNFLIEWSRLPKSDE